MAVDDPQAELGRRLGDGPRRVRPGVGRALIDAVERWADASGYRFITLNVFDANIGAKAFYERVGYTPDAVRYVKEVPQV